MKNININKNLLLGFLAVLLVSGFAYLIGDIVREKISKQNNTQIELIKEQNRRANELSDERERRANRKRDSALAMLNIQSEEINLMNINFSKLNTNINGLKDVYQKNYSELKIYQHEKPVINNSTVAEQADFLSKYRYEEY